MNNRIDICQSVCALFGCNRTDEGLVLKILFICFCIFVFLLWALRGDEMDLPALFSSSVFVGLISIDARNVSPQEERVYCGGFTDRSPSKRFP